MTTKSFSYKNFKADIAKYDSVISRLTAPFPHRLKSFAGCTNPSQLSDLLGALFYICEMGELHPVHQAQFPVLEGWKPGDRLPAECEELLKEKVSPSSLA